ncbi:MAG: sigma-54 dependent transcriptional regulator [Planctomycetes bacterium]|nr:sigma-54 dependent transcriptional regulator [Planctomycetota bacterium]
MADPTVLLVDDEAAARRGMLRTLDGESYVLKEASSGEEALSIIENENIDVALLDVNMPGMSGIELLGRLTKLDRAPLVVMVTAYGSESVAVQAWKSGAYDYITKPYDPEELRLTVRRALEKRKLETRVEQLEQVVSEKEGHGMLIGESQSMRKLYSLIERIAPTDVTVLIRGESGTGKELVSRAIHNLSQRQAKPFVSMNCAALLETLVEAELFGHEKGSFTGALSRRDGKFKQADGGTIFLDEIGDMSAQSQAKLLRVLEERSFVRVGGNEDIHVDVRVVSATNQDLQRHIADGTFREDLYFRLKVVELNLPPLRDRLGDIPLLVSHFLKRYNTLHRREIGGVGEKAMDALLAHYWPGNVRELRNVIESAVVLSDGPTIDLEHLPPEFRPEPVSISGSAPSREIPSMDDDRPFQEVKKEFVEAFERDFLTKKLEENDWNVSRTAELLGMHRQSLQQKLKELGIERSK